MGSAAYRPLLTKVNLMISNFSLKRANIKKVNSIFKVVRPFRKVGNPFIKVATIFINDRNPFLKEAALNLHEGILNIYECDSIINDHSLLFLKDGDIYPTDYINKELVKPPKMYDFHFRRLE